MFDFWLAPNQMEICIEATFSEVLFYICKIQFDTWTGKGNQFKNYRHICLASRFN